MMQLLVAAVAALGQVTYKSNMPDAVSMAFA